MRLWGCLLFWLCDQPPLTIPFLLRLREQESKGALLFLYHDAKDAEGNRSSVDLLHLYHEILQHCRAISTDQGITPYGNSFPLIFARASCSITACISAFSPASTCSLATSFQLMTA